MTTEEPQVISMIQPRRGRARIFGYLLGSLPLLITLGGFAYSVADHTSPPYPLLVTAALTLPLLFVNQSGHELAFDEQHFTLKEGTKVLAQVPWTDVQGYELTRRFIRILRTGGEPVLIDLEIRVNPFSRRTMRYSETKIAAILDALEKHMPDTSFREQCRKASSEPPTALVPGTAYVYINQPILKDLATSGCREVWFYAYLGIVLAAAAFGLTIKVILALSVVIVCALIGATIMAVNAIRDRKRWKNFERTIRSTLMATEDGVQFRGDHRVFRPVQRPDRSEPNDQGSFKMYRNGKEELYVSLHFLRPTTLPLTALSSGTSSFQEALSEVQVTEKA